MRVPYPIIFVIGCPIEFDNLRLDAISVSIDLNPRNRESCSNSKAYFL